jgi:serine/threonine-protein kinase
VHRDLTGIEPRGWRHEPTSPTLGVVRDDTPTSGDLPPRVGGVWLVEHELGRGAMGVVHAARHAETGQRVALKVMSEALGERSSHAERFRREAALLGKLSHEGVVRIVDAGRDEPTGRLWMAMELLEGETLRERLDAGTTHAATLVRLVRAVLPALEAAHALAIVHRDLKPDNVFLVRGDDGTEHVKLLDFGIARPIAERTATQTGIAVGTPWYMSPEQALRPSTVGDRSDVWSVGVMLYEAVTGEAPFDGETPHAVLLLAASEPHTPLHERVPSAPRALSELVDRCLAKRPELRPSAAEVGAALDAILADPETEPALRFRVSHLPRKAASTEATADAPQGTAAVPLVRRVSEPPAAAPTPAPEPAPPEPAPLVTPDATPDATPVPAPALARASAAPWWIGAGVAVVVLALIGAWAATRTPARIESASMPPARGEGTVAEIETERGSEAPTQSAVLAASRSDPRRPENPEAETEAEAEAEAETEADRPARAPRTARRAMSAAAAPSRAPEDSTPETREAPVATTLEPAEAPAPSIAPEPSAPPPQIVTSTPASPPPRSVAPTPGPRPAASPEPRRPVAPPISF